MINDYEYKLFELQLELTRLTDELKIYIDLLKENKNLALFQVSYIFLIYSGCFICSYLPFI